MYNLSVQPLTINQLKLCPCVLLHCGIATQEVMIEEDSTSALHLQDK